MEKTWLKQYPAGVPANIDVAQYPSLVALLEESLLNESIDGICRCIGTAQCWTEGLGPENQPICTGGKGKARGKGQCQWRCNASEKRCLWAEDLLLVKMVKWSSMMGKTHVEMPVRWWWMSPR